jgi:hypothetical protein
MHGMVTDPICTEIADVAWGAPPEEF